MTNAHNGLEIRPLPEDEFNSWVRTSMRGFGAHSSPASERHFRGLIEPDRAIAAYVDGGLVGTATAGSFDLTIPGGELPMPLVGAVAVQPTHQRRGVLSAMMANQMADFRERGEIVAGLSASESLIYARFGYGIATWSEDWTMPRVHADLSDAPTNSGRLRFVDPEDVGEVWPSIYEQVRPHRVGLVRFPEKWWPTFATDLETWRQGASAFFHVVYEGESGSEGFVTYRIRDNSQVLVIMLLGATPEAEVALWRFCFGVDLMDSMFAPNRPADDQLPWMLKDPRRLERSVRDHLWLRLVDVRAALSARSYASGCSVVLEVHDSFCPWNEGRYVLETGPDGAACRPTTRSPDLELSVSELASAYLGGTTLATLQDAGRVEEHRSGAIRELDRGLATERQPWMIEF
ncbi:MAG: GNAT family N-acetyltransferase [SAR202 cluster bacterium]|jgi:predicted acetyltransferase|nr:GNAT family N-acetyltransferase [SAR202 cluster bacterium]MDP6663060.1 GNAT family N-acetyltransferase [SAR202 cluster bacterium]MDP6798751.1 GNAT family N-acetyltransferase [SAR202 cluster bacterium]MQG68186.1 GNAT family N-acetyltransferase [SAR202 cluster bacterium]|tara:strand:+ start:57 stop:1268 length:1212 start_codon:yes stop_codon:yes gene_type:complete